LAGSLTDQQAQREVESQASRQTGRLTNRLADTKGSGKSGKGADWQAHKRTSMHRRQWKVRQVGRLAVSHRDDKHRE
jgi:ribosomal protein L3